MRPARIGRLTLAVGLSLAVGITWIADVGVGPNAGAARDGLISLSFGRAEAKRRRGWKGRRIVRRKARRSRRENRRRRRSQRFQRRLTRNCNFQACQK